MVTGQDDDRPVEPPELGVNERDGLVGHAVVIEEVAGDQHQIDVVRQGSIDHAREGVAIAPVMRRLLLGIAVSVAAEMHVGGVKNAQGASWRRHGEQYATPTSPLPSVIMRPMFIIHIATSTAISAGSTTPSGPRACSGGPTSRACRARGDSA